LYALGMVEKVLPPVIEDHPEDWHEPSTKGFWQKEYRARKYHDCVRHDAYCPGEICPGELYLRTAVLERTPGTRGTVTVTRSCQACAHA